MNLTGGSMTITTEVRVVCAGPSHNHRRVVLAGQATTDLIEGVLRHEGWRQGPDGRWWCPEHARLRLKGAEICDFTPKPGWRCVQLAGHGGVGHLVAEED
jgi:hypothetical protein